MNTGGRRRIAAAGRRASDRSEQSHGDAGVTEPDQPLVDRVDGQRRRHRIPARALPGRACSNFVEVATPAAHDAQRHRADRRCDLSLPRARRGCRRQSERLLQHRLRDDAGGTEHGADGHDLDAREPDALEGRGHDLVLRLGHRPTGRNRRDLGLSSGRSSSSTARRARAATRTRFRPSTGLRAARSSRPTTSTRRTGADAHGHGLRGLTDTETVRLDPRTVVLTFQSSPTGLQLTVGSASDATTFTRTVIQGSTNSISAPSPQTLGGTSYDVRLLVRRRGGDAQHRRQRVGDVHGDVPGRQPAPTCGSSRPGAKDGIDRDVDTGRHEPRSLARPERRRDRHAPVATRLRLRVPGCAYAAATRVVTCSARRRSRAAPSLTFTITTTITGNGGGWITNTAQVTSATADPVDAPTTRRATAFEVDKRRGGSRRLSACSLLRPLSSSGRGRVRRADAPRGAGAAARPSPARRAPRA